MKRIAVLLPLLAACSSPHRMRSAEHPPAVPSEKEAKVVVFRPEGRNNSRDYAIFVDDEPVGFARPGGWFEFRVAPGAYLLHCSVYGGSDVGIRATLAGGRTYFLRAGETPDWFVMRIRFDPVVPGTPEFEAIDETLDGLDAEQPIDTVLEETFRSRGEEVEERRDWYAGEGAAESVELRPQDGRGPSGERK